MDNKLRKLRDVVKSLFSLVLSLVLVLSGFPTQAFAEQIEEATEDVPADVVVDVDEEGEPSASSDVPFVNDEEQYTIDEELAAQAVKEVLTHVPEDGGDAERNRVIFEAMVAILAGNEEADETSSLAQLLSGARDSYDVAEAFRATTGVIGLSCSVVENADEKVAWNLAKVDDAWYHVDVWSAAQEAAAADLDESLMELLDERWLLVSDKTITENQSIHSVWTVASEDTDSSALAVAERDYGWQEELDSLEDDEVGAAGGQTVASEGKATAVEEGITNLGKQEEVNNEVVDSEENTGATKPIEEDEEAKQIEDEIDEDADEDERVFVQSASVVDSGTCGSCTWTLDSDGLLTISSGTLASNDTNSSDFWPWKECATQVQSVQLDGTVRSGDSLSFMFCGCENMTNASLSSLLTAGTTSMNRMFIGCGSLSSLELSGWDTSSVVNMSGMFQGCYALSNVDLSGWDTSSVKSMATMFDFCQSIESLDLSGFNTASVETMAGMFYCCHKLSDLNIAGWNTASVSDTSSMFSVCSALKSLDLSQWDTSSLRDSRVMFERCSSLVSLDLSGWDVSSLDSTYQMFASCGALEILSLDGWRVSSELKTMNSMFEGCRSLTALDLSDWDTSEVWDMRNLFSNCSSLETINLSNWNTGSVTCMSSVFSQCNALRSLDISSWDTAAVEEGFNNMYLRCDSLEVWKVGSGYRNDRDGAVPSVEVNGHTDWYSTNDGVWYTTEEIASNRLGIPDTYTKGASTSKPLSSCTVTLSPTSYTYDGTVKRPTVTVKDGSTTLTEGTHYTVTWPSGCKDAGTYTVTVTGKGNYAGTKSASFTINPRSVSDATVSAISDQQYTGSAIMPTPTVTIGGKTLAAYTDYSLVYSSNTNVGTAKLTIAGKGNYSGSKDVSFRIVSKALSSCTMTLSPTSYTYDGTQKNPSIAVKDGAKTLASGTDYTITTTPSGRTNAGTYTYVVTGKGNYTGTKSASFTISPKSLSSCTMLLSPSSYTYDGTQKNPSTTVKDGSKTLVSGTDYTVTTTPSGRTNAGTYTYEVTGKGNYTSTKSASFTISPVQKSAFTWGQDNWSFRNSSYYGDFCKNRYIDQINSAYRNALAASLTPADYDIVFTNRVINGVSYTGWLNEYWGGSCYGMASLALLSKEGMVPYSNYKHGATALNQLIRPSDDMVVSSLITYYQMIQVRDVIWNEKVATRKRSNEQNINAILSTLDTHSTALVCYRQNDWGGHAVLAYGYEYGSWTKGGVTYNARILICDPNESSARYENCDIYFNTRTYSWAIPKYSKVKSSSGAFIEYVGADVSKINEGGYLGGASSSRGADYVARLDTLEISDDRSVSKVQESAGEYVSRSSDPGEIEEDYSFVYTAEGAGKATPGYNLYDAESAYRVSQSKPEELALVMRYEDYLMSAGSAAGENVVFDNDGYVEVNGQAADYTLSITSNGESPTDWHNMSIEGGGADRASLEVADRGYILTSDNMRTVSIDAHNKDVSVRSTFSTTYDKAYIYEIDSNTIGVSVDADGNGSFETVIADGSTEGATCGMTMERVLEAIDGIPEISTLRVSDETTVTAARQAYESLTDEQKEAVSTSMMKKLIEAERKISNLKKSVQSIIASNKTIAMGEAVSLDARTSGDGRLTYKSSDESILTVNSSGMIIPVKTGVASVTITAAATDNFGSTAKSVTVTVTKGSSSIALVSQSRTYTGKALAYSGTVTKTGSTGKVTFRYYSDAKCAKEVKATDVKTAKTYYVRATVAADANYKDATSVATMFTIVQATNPMTAKSVSKRIVASKVKSKARKVATITVSKAQGAKTFVVTKWTTAKAKKYFQVNRSNGKVTAKKGTPKGTYKFKVKVTAKGNANYKAGTKTVTVKVVVK